MRRLLPVVVALALAGCGGGSAPAPEPVASGRADRAPLALEGARWLGGDGEVLDAARVPAAHAGCGVERVVAFVTPGDAASDRLLRSLAAAAETHPELVVLVATTSLDADTVAATRQRTGARFPVLLGVTKATRDAWASGPEACVRVADRRDQVVARSMIQVLARLEPPPSRK